MKTRYSAIALAVLGFSASAEEAANFKQLLAMDLGEMLKVEVATGTAKQLSEAPAVVSVVTADDIRATGARTLAEAVERVPGLHVALSANRLANMFSIRGIQTNNTPQILILLDGVEISEGSTFATPVSFRLPVNFIQRIEIIRGPGSAVYGADAFSGVINVITRSPSDENQVELGGSIGSFDYREAWVNANLVLEEFKIGLSVTKEQTDNDNDRITPYGVMDRERELDNVHLTIDYGNFSLKNWYWHTRQKMGVGAGIIGNTFDRDIAQTWKTQLDWSGSVTDNIDGSFDISYSDIKTDALFQLFPASVYPIGPDGNLFGSLDTFAFFPDGVVGNPIQATKRIKFNSAFVYSGIEKHRVRVGLGGEDLEVTDVEEFKNFGPGVLDTANLPAPGPDGFPISDTIVDVTGTPFIYSPDYDRELWYVSLQDEWKFAENWELTAGVRYDNYSDFGSTTNPRVALVWNTTETLTSKLLYGTAFRAPKVSELAFINNPANLGNPNLDPEKIQTIELAFDFRPSKRFTGLLNLFTYQSEDLIQLDSTFTFQNIGKQDGYGIEIETNWQATENFRINANLSWLNSELPLTDQDKEQTPGVMGHLDFRYQLSEDWLITMQNYWISDRLRAGGDTRPEVDDYIQSDVTMLWQSNSPWSLRLTVKNLFNEDIRHPSPFSPLFAANLGFLGDFPLESRNIFGSVNFQF